LALKKKEDELKWLSGIWQIVAGLSVKAKTIFVFCVLFMTGGYFYLDRILDYKEARLNSEWIKHWEKPKQEDNLSYVPYSERTTHGNKPQQAMNNK